MLDNLIENSYSAAAYAGVGVVLMAVSFVVIDALTPGKLRTQLWGTRNRNAAVLVSSNLAGEAIIVAAAIVASEGDLGEGLVYTIVYALIGLVIMAVAFVLIDLATPGRLGEILLDETPHPAVWVHATLHVAIGVIVAVSIL
ncbi:MAG: DUF350 domain-containing protein [Gordonia amarae]